eukprot:TRINITY_DN13083_c0_g1_i1.p1 TRINITY_DN13083_c0_g1~~TRINITY_DN13083_c0_g1_i1.p1  ORF type:complete len:502 (+),score=97.31 TRINITY_DN13083_c0_g1_i1:231-1736(+)
MFGAGTKRKEHPTAPMPDGKRAFPPGGQAPFNSQQQFQAPPPMMGGGPVGRGRPVAAHISRAMQQNAINGGPPPNAQAPGPLRQFLGEQQGRLPPGPPPRQIQMQQQHPPQQAPPQQQPQHRMPFGHPMGAPPPRMMAPPPGVGGPVGRGRPIAAHISRSLHNGGAPGMLPPGPPVQGGGGGPASMPPPVWPPTNPALNIRRTLPPAGPPPGAAAALAAANAAASRLGKPGGGSGVVMSGPRPPQFADAAGLPVGFDDCAPMPAGMPASSTSKNPSRNGPSSVISAGPSYNALAMPQYKIVVGGPNPSAAPAVDPEKKNKQILRTAAGEVWEDKTLADWKEDDFRIFVGNLGNDCTDGVLTEAFQKYPTFLKARIVRSKITGKSKGFGFVSFDDPLEGAAALKTMQGKYVGQRPVKLTRSTWNDRSFTKKKFKTMDNANKMSGGKAKSKPRTAREGRRERPTVPIGGFGRGGMGFGSGGRGRGRGRGGGDRGGGGGGRGRY